MVPIPTGECPFEEIAIDCIRELQKSEDFNAIIAITDWFAKI